MPIHQHDHRCGHDRGPGPYRLCYTVRHQVILPLATENGQGEGIAFILSPLCKIFWATTALLLVLLVMSRHTLSRLYAVLDEHAQRIQEDFDLADKTK